MALGVRHHLQLSFHSQAMKEAFHARLDHAKQRLFSEGSSVDNYRLFTGLLDVLYGRVTGDIAQREEPLATPEPLTGFFLEKLLRGGGGGAK